jgi:hypothetical protein
MPSLYQTTPETGTVSSANSTSLYSNTTDFTTGLVNSSVYSVTGGTGISVNPVTGNVVVTNTGVTSIVAGSGITISGSTGAVTISAPNSGVTSITGTANQIIASSSTGAITLSTPQDIATTSSPTFAGQTLTGSLTMNGSSSGSVVLSVPAAAGSSSMIIPSGNSTLVARNTVDTLTNKTISGVNNTISGIGNASLVNSSITLGTTNIALGATSLTPAGLTSVTVTQDPVAAFDLATKQYVDTQVSSGLTFHQPVQAATTASLASITGGTVTYNQPGGAGVGVGATITLSVALTVLDGYTLLNTNRILVKDETNQTYNGVYTWATGGTVLTRATDADTYGVGANQLSLNDYFFTQNGTVNKGIAYVLNAPAGTIIFGTSNITFAEFSSSQVYTGTAPINITGTVISLNTVPITSGGTGQITANAAINALLPNQSGNAGKVLSTDGTNTSWIVNGSGDVVGPASATDNAVVRFDTTTGKLIKNSTVTIDNSGNIVTNGDLAVNGGDITTTQTTGTVFNTTATTLNMGGAATTVSIGAATGTATINNTTLTLPNGSSVITMGNRLRLGQAALTTSATTANQVFASVSTTYHNSKFQVSIISGSDYHSADIAITHNGTTSYIIVSNEMWTNASLTDWNTDISGANVRLLVTPTNAVTTYRTLITSVL